jgi:hypothetical protein
LNTGDSHTVARKIRNGPAAKLDIHLDSSAFKAAGQRTPLNHPLGQVPQGRSFDDNRNWLTALR